MSSPLLLHQILRSVKYYTSTADKKNRSMGDDVANSLLEAWENTGPRYLQFALHPTRPPTHPPSIPIDPRMHTLTRLQVTRANYQYLLVFASNLEYLPDYFLDMHPISFWGQDFLGIIRVDMLAAPEGNGPAGSQNSRTTLENDIHYIKQCTGHLQQQ